MEDTMWFYIKHVHSGKVISVSNEQDQQKSQVIVTEAKYTDSELWCWNDQRLQNKRTKLVLDIRNGKLRLIEDTEICISHKKSDKHAQTQLWDIRMLETIAFEQHPLAENLKNEPLESSSTMVIYSISSSDWVLDIAMDEEKLILFPLHHNTDELQKQKWSIIYEDDMLQAVSFNSKNEVFENASPPITNDDSIYYGSRGSFSSSTSSTSNGSKYPDFAYGLTPSKRNSVISIHTSSRTSSIDENRHHL